MIIDTDYIDRIIAELEGYSLDRLPWVKKQWIHEINVSDFPFRVKILMVYMAGTVCDFVIQEKKERSV